MSLNSISVPLAGTFCVVPFCDSHHLYNVTFGEQFTEVAEPAITRQVYDITAGLEGSTGAKRVLHGVTRGPQGVLVGGG